MLSSLKAKEMSARRIREREGSVREGKPAVVVVVESISSNDEATIARSDLTKSEVHVVALDVRR